MEKNIPLKKSLLGFAIVSSSVNAISAQAAAVTSMTIVEIRSSGVGTSAAGISILAPKWVMALSRAAEKTLPVACRQ